MKILTILALSLVSILISSVQASEAEKDESEKKESDSIILIVTAQKRAESVQEVPISIQAFAGEQLEKMDVQTATDITKILPNINISTQNPVSQAISIRGVGTNDFYSNSAGSVGIYMDEVTMSAPALGGLGLHDLDRVEILRGPQNSLFGRNTTGGAVNYISMQPDIGGDSNAYIGFNLGNHNLVAVDLAGTIQTSNNSALRLAAKIYNQDGVFNNLADDDADIGKKDRKSFRATWGWEPSENTLVTVNFHYGKEDSEVTPYKFIGRRGFGGSPEFFTVGPFPAFAGPTSELDWTTNYGGTNAQGISVDTTDWQDVNIVGDNRHLVEATGGYLKIKHDLDYATFTSITSVDTSETSFQLDFAGPGSNGVCGAGVPVCVAPNPSGGSIDSFAMFNAQDHENDQLSQELRLTSNGEGSFRWIAGLYYFSENSLLSQNMGFGLFGFDVSQSATVIPGGPPFPGQPVGGSFGLLALSQSPNGYSNQAGFNIADFENRVISPYLRTEFDITKATTLTFGLRYTNDKKSANSIQVGNVDTSSLALNTFRSRETILGLAAGLSECDADGDGNPTNGSADLRGLPCSSDVTRPDLEFNGVGGKIGIDHQFENLLLYGSYSRGFRSGKYDIEFFHGPQTGFEIVDLKQETLDAFELGIKSTLLDNTLLINAAVFRNIWNDQQLFDVNPLAGPTFINVEESSLIGFEAEIKWAINDDWFLQGGVGVLDTEIKKQGDDPDTGGPEDLIELGHELPNAPNFSWNLLLEREFEIAGGFLSLQADAEYRSSSKTAQTTRQVTDEYDSFKSFGIQASYSFGEFEQYQITLYGDNLTNEEVCNYELDLAAFSGTAYCLPNDGEASYGVKFKMHSF